MAGSHVAHRTASNSKWKIVLLVVILLVVILALGVLLLKIFKPDLIDAVIPGLGQSAAPTADPSITTQVNAEYGNGRSMVGSISVSQGTQRPADIPEDANVVLLDIDWTSKKEMSEPLYITVSDPSFPDGDGLAVHHCGSDGQWTLIGTYVIRDHAVTFLTDSLSPFAFQVISAAPPEPIATSTPEPTATAEPTATPEPTPEPTPAPIQAVDYGQYAAAQAGVFTMINEMADDTDYVVALVKDLPTDALTVPEGDEEEDAEDEGLTLSYVEAPDAEPAAEPEQAAPSAPIASVLVNLDGSSLGLIDMELVQSEDGVWCLKGPVTEGMLWTSNRDGYKDEKRFSLKNNGRYLNLDDDDKNVILNDNSIRTRWLIQGAKLLNGTEIATLNYRNDSRFYVDQMAIASETMPGGTPASVGAQTSETSSTGPVYIGASAPADTSAILQYLRFTVTKEESQALQLVLFALDEDIEAPDGVVNTLEHGLSVPEITANVNLNTLEIRDGEKVLQLGVDYTVNARVYNGSVVVVIQFMGDYTGQIVRTFPGTTFMVDGTVLTTPTPAPSPSPIPSPSPTPYTGGEGSNAPPATNPPATNPPATNPPSNNPPSNNPPAVTDPPAATNAPPAATDAPPAATDAPPAATDVPAATDAPPATGTNTEPEPAGDPSDTNT